jgi:hypothetical protein
MHYKKLLISFVQKYFSGGFKELKMFQKSKFGITEKLCHQLVLLQFLPQVLSGRQELLHYTMAIEHHLMSILPSIGMLPHNKLSNLEEITPFVMEKNGTDSQVHSFSQVWIGMFDLLNPILKDNYQIYIHLLIPLEQKEYQNI